MFIGLFVLITVLFSIFCYVCIFLQFSICSANCSKNDLKIKLFNLFEVYFAKSRCLLINSYLYIFIRHGTGNSPEWALNICFLFPCSFLCVVFLWTVWYLAMVAVLCDCEWIYCICRLVVIYCMKFLSKALDRNLAIQSIYRKCQQCAGALSL